MAAERALVTQQAGHGQVDLRPQLAQVVLQRRAGQAHAARRAQGEHGATRLGARVLHLLRLVEHDQRERLPAQGGHVARQQRVAGQHHVLRAELAEVAATLRAMQGEHLE